MTIQTDQKRVERALSIPHRRVWITGAGGLIGNALVQSASLIVPGWQIYGTTRHQVDLADTTTARETFHTLRPDVIIHCAALSKTPVCDRHPTLARTLNVDMTVRLAELARDIRFIFLSTDLVFDGRVGQYDETAEVNPLSVYAETKVEAERRVLTNPKHTVIRTSLNGGTSPTGDRGFNEELRQAWHAGRAVSLFMDEFRCPLFAGVTARAVWELVAHNHSGVFHLAGSERLSRWRIGQLLAQRWPRLDPKLEPTSRLNYPGAARPADTSLNCAKIQHLLSFPLPGLTDWLASHPDEIF
jgi:dTDP-4-dehydrorhamnose reductase